MDLEQSLGTAGRLRDALAAEVESARRERQLLRTLDASALFARASERAAFLSEVARLEAELSRALAGAAAELGPGGLTLDRLQAHAPVQGGALAAVLSDVRALAGALREIDRLNLQLAGRALSCVRGYVEAIHPVPRAYDRRGARASAAPALALVSAKG
jgi:flagellar FlgN protein